MTDVEANFYALFAEFKRWPRAQVQDRPDLLWTLTDIPFPLFNGVLRAHLEPDAVDATVSAVQDACRERGVPMLWWLGPDTRPADLADHLQTHGFAPAGTAVGMDHALSGVEEPPAPPDGVTVEFVPADDQTRIALWCRLSARGFGMPEFVGEALTDYLLTGGGHRALRSYLGCLNGEPVATGTLYVHKGVAGIYNVATLPEARRQGIAAAVVRAALRDAKGMGAEKAILHATPMGAALYRQLGFEEVCPLSRYVWTPT